MKTSALTKQTYSAKADCGNVWNIKTKAIYKTQKKFNFVLSSPIYFLTVKVNLALNLINKPLLYKR